MNKIPLMDLKKQYQGIKSEIDEAIRRVIDSAVFVGGPERENFEKEFAEAIGVKHCIGMANGTDALFIGLKAMGITTGDEVVTVANSFIASSEAITAAGARVRFVDCRESDFLMDLDELEKCLKKHSVAAGGKVKAVIPVHLYGQVHEMKKMMEIAERYHVMVLEDTAQAHFAESEGKQASTWGHAGTFSFYPGKNLGAFGDAGALVTNDDKIAILARKIANHGRTKKYDHDMEGYNSRLDTLQAAILRVKLKHLRAWTEARIEKAEYYTKRLSRNSKVILPQTGAPGNHVFHLYVVRVSHRDKVLELMKSKGIEASIHYPITLPSLEAYSYLGHKPGDFPVAEKLSQEILSLPLYPEISVAEMDAVIEVLNQATN